jgi:hypothetical protein
VSGLGQDAVEQVEGARERLRGDRAPQPTQHLFEQAMHIAAPGQRIGVGLQGRGLELAVDQPPDRAVGVRLQGPRREDLAVADVGQCGLAQRADRRGNLAGRGRACRRPAAGQLPVGGRGGWRPHHVGQHAPLATLGPVFDEQLGDVFQERGRKREIALLVGAAVAQDHPLGGARDARVEEVALARERVLAGAQPQPAAGRQLAAQLVGQERLGRGPERELVLLKAADDDDPEAPRADREGIAHEDRAGRRRRAGGQLERFEQLDQLLAGRACLHLGELAQSALERRDRAGVDLLGRAEHRRAPAVGSGQQSTSLARKLGAGVLGRA